MEADESPGGAPTTAPSPEPEASPPPGNPEASQARALRLQYAQTLYGNTCGARGCKEPFFGFARPTDPAKQTAYVCGAHPELVIHAVRKAAATVEWDAITGVFHVHTGTMLYPPEA